jgi:diaminopropionate ammonia-lyase
MSLMPANKYHLNSAARSGPPYLGLFADEEYKRVGDYYRSRPHLQPTPLRHLRGLASAIGIADILLKDESSRFSLNSFKILGTSYAVDQLLNDGHLTKGSVLVCATEGNHGRAVVRVAAEHQLEAKVYVSSATADARIEALRREGAEVLIVDGNYDDAVRQSTLDAESYGWTVISDTSWPGYELVPRLIMAGYTRLLDEAEEQWRPEPPDVALVQAGVGGLASAVVSWLCRRYGARRPFIVVCEPSSAACVLESAHAGKKITLEGPFDTIMAGLRCGEVSNAAWPVMAKAVDAFVAIDDEQCAAAMRMLARPQSGDQIVEAGASGACGLASLAAILREESLRPVREAIGLNAQSRVFVINTEGATDPELYARIIGNGGSAPPATFFSS